MVTPEDLQSMSDGELVAHYANHPNDPLSEDLRQRIHFYLEWRGPYTYAGGDESILLMRQDWCLLKAELNGEAWYRLPNGEIAHVDPDQGFGFGTIGVSEFLSNNKAS